MAESARVEAPSVKLAIKLHDKDNVATATATLSAGEAVSVLSHEGKPVDQVVASTDVPLAYHKIALVDLAAGELVYKYGEVVGRATAEIKRGAWVHVHNVESAHIPESAAWR
ncbi:MAG: UxaA family hydrolase [Chloroflexi bacterium]|nr:UxaA family hydrolase [Chloroflexota bacterium]